MIKKQYTIADVLHLAADKYLAFKSRIGKDHIKEKYSCCAVYSAIFEITDNLHSDNLKTAHKDIFDGFVQMGCDIGSISLFKKYGDEPFEYDEITPDVQGMRYMWLKWAALMAEEQGI